LPQEPQLLVSLFKSTQAPPQSVWPVLQVNVHASPAHAACALATVVVHAFPQAPQLSVLLVVFTHVAPHAVGVAAGQAETHGIPSVSDDRGGH
jgi:hypothetical protein